MPVHFQRLDNALKRANEFIEVGKNLRALEILSDVLKSRKHRVWQAKHEEIMYKFLELCVSQQKSFVAKEGLYQYKIICQQTYIKSFEEVVRRFLEMAEQRANQAREKCATAELGLEDLDQASRPEEMLLCAVSSEDTQDRQERVVLLPWVKFLWDTYRHCLELLRNNPRTERLYHDIAYQTFQFCVKFNRKPEMRKLCDNLHTHLDYLKKLQANASAGAHQNIISLSNPESQGMHLETRLVQLDCAIQMELWQEAYKATDDIKKFGLMSLARKQPKPQLMASYYQKLSLVFWKANSPLFHAAALLKHFHLSKELRKNITPEDVERMASRVVFAVLAVPIPPNRLEIDKIVDTEENVIENNQRNLSSLLGLPVVPTRASLVRDIEKLGVLQYAYPELQLLYHTLEISFSPLQLAGKVQKAIDFVQAHPNYDELKQYVQYIKEVTVVRLLKEISQVYQTLEYRRLLELCPFVNSIHLEQMLVASSRRNDLQVRIDHRKQCLYFGKELRIVGGDEIIEGPHLQSNPSDLVRRQLVNMYSTLCKVRALIEPHKLKTRRNEIKHLIMERYMQHADHEHKALLDRQEYIEKKREELEQKGIEREKEERREIEERQQRIREAEEERLRREADERETQRRIRELQDLQKKMARDQIEKMKQTDAGQRILSEMGEEALYELKPEEIKSRQWKQIEKERREQTIKQKKIEKKVDHLERAKRLEEIPLLKDEYEQWKVKDRELWDELELERIKTVELEREQALKHKERLMRMVPDTEKFMEQVQKVRHEAYLTRFAQWQKAVEEERDVRLLERRRNRKEERRRQYYHEKQRAEAKRRLEEEQAEEKRRKERQEQQLRERQEEERKRQEELRAERARIAERNAAATNSRPYEARGAPARYIPPAGAAKVAEDERDFANLRRARPDTTEIPRIPTRRDEKDLGTVRNRPPTEEKDFANIRSQPRPTIVPEEKDLGAFRQPHPVGGEERDFANIRTRAPGEDRDYGAMRRQAPPTSDERDFTTLRSAPRPPLGEEKDFGNVRREPREEKDLSILRAPKEINSRINREPAEEKDLSILRAPKDSNENRPQLQRRIDDRAERSNWGRDQQAPRNREPDRDFSNIRNLGPPPAPRDNRDAGDRFQSNRVNNVNSWRRTDEPPVKKEIRRPPQTEDKAEDDNEWHTVQKKR